MISKLQTKMMAQLEKPEKQNSLGVFLSANALPKYGMPIQAIGK